MKGIDIPILGNTEFPEHDIKWTSVYGSKHHPDFQEPVFFRHNLSSLNLFGTFTGETLFLIGRGPSLGEYLENPEIKKRLYDPCVMKYCMNTSIESMDYNCNFWSICDKPTKFTTNGFKMPNIMKFIPMNRFKHFPGDDDNKVRDRTFVYQEGKRKVYTCFCPNTYGVNTFLLGSDCQSINFPNAFLGSPSVLYGTHKGYKSVLFFSLKVALLLGFSKIVLLGVDFKMREDKPYYKTQKGAQPKHYIDHNNKLYNNLGPYLTKIIEKVNSGQSSYRSTIYSGKKIDTLPDVPVVDVLELLKKDIKRKREK